MSVNSNPTTSQQNLKNLHLNFFLIIAGVVDINDSLLVSVNFRRNSKLPPWGYTQVTEKPEVEKLVSDSL
jgi:hypothetical protein